jgi:hypothetical protein
VCGGDEIDVDEVLDAGVLRLATCTRCGRRWTERPLLALESPFAWTETETAEAA